MRESDTTFGPDYDEETDGKRIADQMRRILKLMADAHWRTLSEIEGRLGYPQASISAQLRHLRKEKFGSYLVNKRRRVDGLGTWEYQVLPPPPPVEPEQKALF